MCEPVGCGVRSARNRGGSDFSCGKWEHTKLSKDAVGCVVCAVVSHTMVLLLLHFCSAFLFVLVFVACAMQVELAAQLFVKPAGIFGVVISTLLGQSVAKQLLKTKHAV